MRICPYFALDDFTITTFDNPTGIPFYFFLKTITFADILKYQYF